MHNAFLKKLSCFGLILGTCALLSYISAQTLPDSTARDTSLTILPPMTVSVTRLKVEPEKLPQKIELIDPLDLALTPAQDITDVLKKNASIDVVQYPGLLSVVGIRGFRPSLFGVNSQTLTLINGRQAGTTNLASLQTFNLERIEVVKGPVSALYGPQAMGGVINVIPKRSTGEISTHVKTGLGSFGTKEFIAHSGGSLCKYLDFDFSGLVFDQGKDFRIGSEYSLKKLDEDRYSGKPQQIFANGDTVDINDIAAGTIRHYTKYDKQNFSLRLGTALFEDKIIVDARGEIFNADAVETPGDISTVDNGSGMKGVCRNDEEVSITGNFGFNQVKALQYWAREASNNYGNIDYNDTMYTSYSGTNEWLGFQLKDDIYIPIDVFFIKPIVTIGLDYNNVEASSRRWQQRGKEVAPYSPDSRLSDLGVYSQFFGDLKNGLATATVGLRYDAITAKMISSHYFPNNKAREETFDVFSPSYGLTFSPLKTLTKNYEVTLYHNLGKGFRPQSASNLAGYSVSKPDTTGRVQIQQGNPDLEPESNITVDGGIRCAVTAVGLDVSLGLYRTIVENYVQSYYERVPAGKTEIYNGIRYPVAAIMSYRNSDDKTTMAGLEWDLEWNILRLFDRQEKLAITTNGHAVLVSESVTGGDTSEVKNVRNPNFTVGLTYDDTRRITFRLQTRFSGKQKDTDYSSPVFPYPDIIYPPFLVTDISMRIKINEHNALSASVSNVTDENYYEKRGYNLPGRAFSLDYEFSF